MTDAGREAEAPHLSAGDRQTGGFGGELGIDIIASVEVSGAVLGERLAPRGGASGGLAGQADGGDKLSAQGVDNVGGAHVEPTQIVGSAGGDTQNRVDAVVVVPPLGR